MTENPPKRSAGIPLLSWILLLCALTAAFLLIPEMERSVQVILGGCGAFSFLMILIWIFQDGSSSNASDADWDSLSITPEPLPQEPEEVPETHAFSDAQEAWFSICQILGQEIPIEKTLNLILPQIQQLFSGDSLALYVREVMDTLALQLRIGDERTGPSTVHLSECQATEKGKTSLRLFEQDSEDDAPETCCIHHQVKESSLLACAPIRVEDRYLGMLTIVRPLTPNQQPSDTEKDQLKQQLEALSSILGLYLHNLTLKGLLQHHTIRDSLTGLFNRRYMEETLFREIAEAQRKNQPIGIITIRPTALEKIKKDFDTKGVEQILWEIGQRIPHYIRTEDIPCRMEHDLFCIILPGANRDIVEMRANQIRQDMDNISMGYHSTYFNSSIQIGISIYPEDSQSVHTLLDIAKENLGEKQ